MNRNLSRRWCARRRLLRSLCGMVDDIVILRPEIDEWGQRKLDKVSEVCRGKGYRYYKFERTSLTLEMPGQLSREKSERVLFLPKNGLEACCQENRPEQGDIFELDGRLYSIWSVQEAGDLYLTLVVEQIQ
ncbi:MAG: hypothetical protein HFE85_00225 [Clostridiales bacterium]|nr:hypothetical protein [Clostridiales bacterium]